MPELPEVETLRRELMKAVKGKTFKSIDCNWPKMVRPLSLPEFQNKIKNKKIIDINRRAKVLVFELSGGFFLLIHLKMSGQLVFIPNKLNAKSYKRVAGGHSQPGGLNNLPNKFTHATFSFSDGSTLYFNDLRKFGWLRLVDKPQVDKLSSEFGPEPLSKEFTPNKLEEILSRYPNRKIKQSLLDQSLIAGIGNIYADESCFCAKIMPTRIVKTLKRNEIKKLYSCILKILKLAITKKGTSADTYVQLNGKSGGMVPYLKVYGRKAEKCKRCGAIIQKIKLHGRGTHFCQKCQK